MQKGKPNFTIPCIFVISILMWIFCVRASGQSAVDLTIRGNYRLQKGEYHRALDNYHRALAVNPNYVPAILGAADAYAGLRYYNEAIGLLEKATELPGKRAETWARLGDMYRQIGRYGDSERAYRASLKANANYFPAEIGIVGLLRRQGQTAVALAKLRRLTKRFPGKIAVYHEYFELYLRMKKKDHAFDAIQSAKNIDPNDPQIYVNTARWYMARWSSETPVDPKALDKAIEQLDISLQYMSVGQKAEIRKVKGDIFLQKGEWRSAYEIFRRLLRQKNPDAMLFFKAGVASARMGKTDEAAEHFASALQRNNKDSISRTFVEGFVVGENFAIHHPLRQKLAKWRYNMAEHFYKRNLDDSAVYEVRRALFLDPDMLEAHFRLLDYYRYHDLLPSYIRRLKRAIQNIHPENKKMISYYQLRLEQAVRNRRRRLYFQKQLQYPFSREPVTISIRKPKLAPYDRRHPGLSDAFVELMRFQIRNIDRFSVASDGDFILNSELDGDEFRVSGHITVTHRNSGVVYQNFSIEEMSEEALDRITLRVARRLDEKIPRVGNIVAMDHEYVYINLGVPENLQKGDSILFLRSSREAFFAANGILSQSFVAKGSVDTVDGYISRVSFKKNAIDRIRKDDLVVYIGPKKKTEKTPAKEQE